MRLSGALRLLTRTPKRYARKLTVASQPRAREVHDLGSPALTIKLPILIGAGWLDSRLSSDNIPSGWSYSQEPRIDNAWIRPIPPAHVKRSDHNNVVNGHQPIPGD